MSAKIPALLRCPFYHQPCVAVIRYIHWGERSSPFIMAGKLKAFRPPKNWSNRGQMSRVVLSILRQATEPITTGILP
jgi:hypothetical protein